MLWGSVAISRKKMKRVLLILSIICALSLWGCSEGLPTPTPPDTEQGEDNGDDNTGGDNGEDNKGDDGEQSKPDVVVVNGTEIDSATTLFGVVTDGQSGEGIENIVVSDGFVCVSTDSNGVYQIVRNPNATVVFITIPAEYQIPVDNGNHPNFYKRFTIAADEKFRHDFTLNLLPGGKESTFTLLTLADIQVNDNEDVVRFRDETMPDIDALAPTLVNPYGVTLGDVTNKNASVMWTKVKQAMANRSMVFMQCMGNHDHLNEFSPNDHSKVTTFWKSVENFQKYFGPQNYSFDRSDTHIVVMDNALHGETPPDGTYEYAAGFFDWQVEWLKQDLSYVPKDKMVLLCCHIPFRDGTGGNHSDARYRQQVLDLLSEFEEAHLMIGHTHRNRNWIHTVNGKKIYEHIHGAVCGGMWHSITNVDGTPNGYGVYEIEGNTIKNWYYKGTNCSVDMQIRAYDGGQHYYDPRFSKNQPSKRHTFPDYTWGLDGYIIANIWNIEHGNWEVTLWQNGKRVCTMEKLNSRDWWVAYWYMEVYCTLDEGYRGDSVHLYKGKLADPNAPFTIRAIDKSGKRKTMTCTELTTDFSNVFGDFITQEEAAASTLSLPENEW